MRKTNLAQLLRGRPDGIFVAPFEQGEVGPDAMTAPETQGAFTIGWLWNLATNAFLWMSTALGSARRPTSRD
jgi:hypothetical protein